jgi:hypothetical protein
VPLTAAEIEAIRDPLHRKARNKALADPAVRRRPKEARFREHDELRYSLRSIRKATSSWKYTAVHLVTADVNPGDPSHPERRLGLVPQWLNMKVVPPRSEHGPPPVYLHHGKSFHSCHFPDLHFADSELFRLISTGARNPSAEEVDSWRNKALPTFNRYVRPCHVLNEPSTRF